MNLPNRLTLARLVLASLFVFSMSVQFPASKTSALALFALAVVTDYLDGLLARRWGLVTDFGKLMDPLVDKILTAAAFVLLAPAGAIAPWVVIAIISREFLITGLRLLASSKGILLPAEKLGKHKTAWQMITVLYFLLLLASREWLGEPAWWRTAWDTLGGVLVAVTAALTVYSGIAYLWKNRSLIEEK